MTGPPLAARPGISVLADSRPPEAKLCEVRDDAGELVRTCTIDRGRDIVAAGFGVAVGKTGQHVRLFKTPHFARTIRMSDCNITIKVDPDSGAIEHDNKRCAAYSKGSKVPHPAQPDYIRSAETNRERLEAERQTQN